MGKCLIFCAADFDGLLQPVGDGDYILAADGGLRHLQALQLQPHGILGDFDSLGYVPQGATVFPVEKDDTDSMLAVRRGLELGYREMILYGAAGGSRPDHTLANYQTLCYLAEHGAAGYLVWGDWLVTAAKEEKLTFPAGAEGILSVFCMGGDATVTLENLQYPLQRGSLSAAFPLGVSNHFTGEAATVHAESGCILVMYPRNLGLPART